MTIIIKSVNRNENNVITSFNCYIEGLNTTQTQTWHKNSLIYNIEAWGSSSVKTKDGTLVHVVRLHNGNKYLRTDANQIAEDNLENL